MDPADVLETREPRYHGRERIHLIRARKLLRLERRELAAIVGVSKETVFKIEKGQRDPTLALMKRWVQALGPYGNMELFLDWPAEEAEQQQPAA